MNEQYSRLTNNGSPFKIQHKFRDRCLVPDVAIDMAHRTFKLYPKQDTWGWHNAEFVTTDGVRVSLEYIATWMGDCQEVNEYIKEMYRHNIVKHKTFYLINNSCAWHLIKMVKI